MGNENLTDQQKIAFLESALGRAMFLLKPLIPENEWSVCLALGGAIEHQVAMRLLAEYNEYERIYIKEPS